MLHFGICLINLLIIGNGLKSRLLLESEFETQCLPNGCYYDLEKDITKQIECKPDGSLEIVYFEGNNGCDYFEYILADLFYKSPLQNPCCIAEEQPAVCQAIPCINDAFCDPPNNPQCYCDKEPGANTGTCRSNPRIGENCVADRQCYDGMQGGDRFFCQFNPRGDGICALRPETETEPEAEAESTPTPYTIQVINKSGGNARVGIFETNPSDIINEGGYPIIFASQYIEDNEGSGTFSWTTDWGLSWSSGEGNECQPLEDGIIYSRTGENIAVSPVNNQNNGVGITYDLNEQLWDISAKPNINLQPGQLQIHTDDSFTNTVAQSDCFTVCLTMNGGDTVFAMDGSPSSDYLLTIKPTYYLSTVAISKGETVDATVISQAKQIQFLNGATKIQCILNEVNQFVDCGPVTSHFLQI